MTDVTLGASGLWLGTRTGAGGTATLIESFFGLSPWLQGQQVYLREANIQEDNGVDRRARNMLMRGIGLIMSRTVNIEPQGFEFYI